MRISGEGLQGYLAHNKVPPAWTLQSAYAYGPRAVPGGGSVSDIAYPPST